MTQVLTVLGARPQFIKAGVVSRALASRGVDEMIVHTGQHFDTSMSEVFFEELGIPAPAYNLGIGSLSHGQMTGRQLERVEEVLLDANPSLVLVYGDTNSALAGALAAAKLGIPVAHVEAGLRSWNRAMPEEVNRVLVDHLADIAFAPTRTAVANLAAEGIRGDRVHHVGDVMLDAALHYRHRSRQPAQLELEDGAPFVLCTVHRAQNTDDPHRLRGILDGLVDSGLDVVWPVHPRTRARLSGLDLRLPRRITLLPPVTYLEMVWLERHCTVVATDSGGVQKEAFFHNKPCVTFRRETEWVELVGAGSQVLVDADATAIAKALTGQFMPTTAADYFGRGDASEKIAHILARQTVDTRSRVSPGVEAT